jgi:hypothetical protein
MRTTNHMFYSEVINTNPPIEWLKLSPIEYQILVFRLLRVGSLQQPHHVVGSTGPPIRPPQSDGKTIAPIGSTATMVSGAQNDTCAGFTYKNHAVLCGRQYLHHFSSALGDSTSASLLYARTDCVSFFS